MKKRTDMTHQASIGATLFSETKWSKYQQDIFDWIETGKGSAVVVAVAGSGKTSTIVECARRIPSEKHCAFVAFNKSIADELKKRLPAHVRAQTLNGMGFGAWNNYNGKTNLDADKVKKICWNIIPQQDQKNYSQGVIKLVNLAKAVGLVPEGIKMVFPLVYDTEQNWFDLLEHYGIEFEGNNVNHSYGVELARKVLTQNIYDAEHTIDFNDQIYMPVICRAKFWQNDYLFVDEAQDVNGTQRAMLKLALKPGGRLIAVGDGNQAIYGFRGADVSSIENIKKEFAAIELPLSISYRCPQLVVREAQKYVSHIQPAETAPMGKVETLKQYDASIFQDTDGVVCRNTAPVVELAYKLIRQKKACRVLGRDIGQGLVTLIKKMNANSIDMLETKLEEFAQREIQKAMAKGNENTAGAISDKMETIRIFIDHLQETERTIEQLIRNIESLFTDNNVGVCTLQTVHKSKGMQYPRVFILDRHRMPSKWARQAWQQQQEVNLQYVAVTRAMSELYYIDLEGCKDTRRANSDAKTGILEAAPEANSAGGKEEVK